MNKLTGVGDITGDGRPDLIAVRAGHPTGFAARVQLTAGWNG